MMENNAEEIQEEGMLYNPEVVTTSLPYLRYKKWEEKAMHCPNFSIVTKADFGDVDTDRPVERVFVCSAKESGVCCMHNCPNLNKFLND